MRSMSSSFTSNLSSTLQPQHEVVKLQAALWSAGKCTNKLLLVLAAN